MERLVVFIVVTACIFNVNSYVINDENSIKNDRQEIDVDVPERKSHGGSGQRHRQKMADGAKSDKRASQSLESVVLALNTGIKNILEKNNHADLFDKYAKKIVDLFSDHAHKSKAGEHKYRIKPEIVHFNAEKPAKKFELNANVLSNLITGFLKSDVFNRNFDNIVRQASMVYRAVQNADKSNN